jgi:thiosulfate dehydrogenase [quinone] large subunit
MNKELAFAILRVGLGLNILFHGLIRLPNLKKFSNSLTEEFEGNILPSTAVSVFGYSLPLLETIVGILLTIGLFTQSVLIAGALIMIVLLFGKSLKSEWQIVSFQQIYILIYALLLFLLEFNLFSFDFIFLPKTNRPFCFINVL